jgi:hypothetical protein
MRRGTHHHKEVAMTTMKELNSLYREDQEVLDIVTSMDIELVLQREFKILKKDFAPGEWNAMIARCAQRIKRQTMYKALAKLVWDDMIEAIGTLGDMNIIRDRNRS